MKGITKMNSTTIRLTDEELQRVDDLKYRTKRKSKIGLREIFLTGLVACEKIITIKLAPHKEQE